MAIPIEHERRFLVVGNEWRRDAVPSAIRQGYLSGGGRLSVRVRRRGDQAFLTLKSKSRGASRVEFEYPIPAEHADYLLNWGCDRLPIEKVRYELALDGRIWEIDEFLGANRGLVLAEIELDRPDEPLELPPWIGREVTGDTRFSNSHLYLHPYRSWALGDAAPELARL
jgi:adenylate cyclase